MSRRQSPAQVCLDMVTDPADLAALAVFEAEVAERRDAALAAAQGRPVAFDCETAGKVWCWTCAISGPERCLEDHLPAEVHEACEAKARRLAVLRDGAPCHDCAFLAASHEAGEEGLLAKLTRQREAFHCHQAMPLDGRGKVPADGDFAPRDHSRYPVCAGWARARSSYLLRVRAAKALAPVRRAHHRPQTMHARVLRQLGVARFDRCRRRGGRPGKVARPDLCLWCVTPRRLSVRSSLTIAQQRAVFRGVHQLGELRRRELAGVAEHRVVGEVGNTPWRASIDLALDAFAVVLVRAGHRGPREPGPLPPYTRPPKKPQPPRPKRRGRPRPLPKPLLLRAA